MTEGISPCLFRYVGDRMESAALVFCLFCLFFLGGGVKFYNLHIFRAVFFYLSSVAFASDPKY